MEKLTLEQTQIVGLTMELELKTKEYQNLCKEFEELKSKQLDPNADEYAILQTKFLKNQKDIKDINEKLKKLQDN